MFMKIKSINKWQLGVLILLVVVLLISSIVFSYDYGSNTDLSATVKKEQEAVRQQKVLARIPLFFMGSYTLIRKLTHKQSK